VKYLLDTDMCSYIARGRPSAVRERFEHLTVGDLGMSCVTYGELAFGCRLQPARPELFAALERLVELIPVVPVTQEVGLEYAEVRALLQSKGALIGPNDLWIAAQARHAGLVLVTNNVKEFKRVPHLKVENWAH
jgi:tRNA(fMet)-specific endonuclease VapC